MRRCGLAIWLLLAGCGPETATGPHGQDAPPRPVAVKPFAIDRPDLVLLITGGTSGMLEVCNCRGPMPGGLARRSGLVRSYRAAFPNTFVLDTGDAFWIEPNDLRNDYVYKGYARVGYDAVVLGDQEWAAGAGRLGRILADANVPALSTTVRHPALQPPRVVTRDFGRAKLAVLCDLRDDAFRFVPREFVEPLHLSDPAEVARRVEELKRAGYVVVLVAHVEEDVLEDLAPSCRADLILRAHTNRSDPRLLSVGSRPVVKVGGPETVAAVALRLRDGGAVEWDYRLEVVDTRWPLDKRLIQIYQAYAHAAMRRALDAERKEGLDYLAPEACGHCHQKQHAFWQGTRHARAYQTLRKADRTGDPHCLMCHTSGFGTKTGFYTIEKTPRLAVVNCQDCHRYNDLEHRQKGFLFERVGKDVCTTCHTPVTDPRFDFRRKLPKVRCPPGPKPPPMQARPRPLQTAGNGIHS